MYPPEFGYYKPESLADALDFLKGGNVKPIAGGQSLIPMLKFRIIQPKFLLDLNPLKELSYVIPEENEIRIGALTRYSEMVKSGIVRRDLPLLHEASGKVGDLQVRNMGTIGGSLSNADPSADFPAVSLAYDAKIKLISTQGEREVNAKDFFKGPFTTELREDELLKEVEFPILKGYKHTYAKIVRRAGDFALVGMAVLAKVGETVEDIRIAYTGVSDKPYRSYELEKTLIGSKPNEDQLRKFSEDVIKEVNPPSDSRGSSDYKKKVMKNLTFNTLKEVLLHAS
ncbi:glyceraldehyde dehydrogenase subunit beta [Acidianus sp. HS-5]|uniref:glyceraldehyde dehydrogenase subunit beta n=1 Tax=Acidianus sp. HS-5 TaxID=2886040 RepID=UPI001F27B895|nr:glyceraldehyde dehydrogenase subunit beta [Acidianus sp. HS-5]BDC17654.1 carbon monoxide dehydrogenase [Acidianus sp. HS-5]